MSETQRYRDLASAAKRAGHHVTPSQVHRWVRYGLLPPASKRQADEQAGAEAQAHSTSLAQLVALCRARTITRSPAALALLLWLDGHAISGDRVRTSLRASLPNTPTRRLSEAQRDRLSSLALRNARAFRRELPPAGLSEIDAAEVAEFLIRHVLGDMPELGPSVERALRKAMGLDRAASDVVRGSGPWLEQNQDVMGLLGDFTLADLHHLVRTATDEELTAVRQPARALVYDLPRVAEALELMHGRGVAGFGPLRMIEPAAPELAIVAALRAQRVGLGDNLRLVAAAGAAPELQSALAQLPEARKLVSRHPQRRTIQRIGLATYRDQPARPG